MSIAQSDYRSSTYELYSGAVIDLKDLDTRADLNTSDDCMEAMGLVERKIIDIEYHLDLVRMGMHPDGELVSPERPLDRTWEPRANKALAISKLQKSEINYQMQRLAKAKNDAEKAVKQANIERAFVERAKLILPQETFSSIIEHVLNVIGKTKP